MILTSEEYCKKCHKYTTHSTTLRPEDKIKCDTCGTEWSRSKDYYSKGFKKGSNK